MYANIEVFYLKRVAPDEYYNDGLFEIARYGKVISTANNMTNDQHNAFLDEITANYDETVNEIDEIVREIRSLVVVTDPVNLLNYIYSMNMFCSLNKESDIDYSE